MSPADRLVLYIAQAIRDEDGYPSRTKLLKVIYLIDVEYFRRYRRTLTGWEWIFYKYGPYVFEFPNTLERLGLQGLEELEGTGADGRKFFGYSVREDQSLDGVVEPRDLVFINRIIKQWALEDLDLLLNYVYFDTEPMMGAERGGVLDFAKIPPLSHEPIMDWSALAPTDDMKTRVREKLAELRKAHKENRKRIRELLKEHPFERDQEYIDAMKDMDRGGESRLPDGSEVGTSQ